MGVSVCTLFLSWIFRTFRFARRYFFGRFSLHDVPCRNVFTRLHIRYFYRGFFGRFSLHVLFATNLSDASACTTFFLLRIFLTLQFARRSVLQRVYKIVYPLFLSRIFRTFQFARSFCCQFFGCFSLHDVIFALFYFPSHATCRTSCSL